MTRFIDERKLHRYMKSIIEEYLLIDKHQVKINYDLVMNNLNLVKRKNIRYGRYISNFQNYPLSKYYFNLQPIFKSYLLLDIPKTICYFNSENDSCTYSLNV